MKTIHFFKICRLIQAAALSASLIFSSSAFAIDRSAYIVDLNSGKVTDIGSLGGGDIYATAMNDSGQVVGGSETVVASPGEPKGYSGFITGPNGVGMTNLGIRFPMLPV